MKFSKQTILFSAISFIFICLSFVVWFGQFKMGDGSELILSTKLAISFIAITSLGGVIFDIFKQISETNRLYKEFNINTKYNIKIKPNGYNIDIEKANIEIDWMIYKFENYGIKNVINYLNSYGDIFCEFHPEIITAPGTTFKVMGYSYRDTKIIHVSYFNRNYDRTDPSLTIEATAFSHELAHLVLFKARPELTEDEHHKIIAAMGLS